MSQPLAGKVCLVTGASRGIGRGIAVQLGEAGATVYITGRTLKKGDGQFGSLESAAEEIEARGGRCIPVACDHSKDDDIKALFERISRDQDGRLDILVNNAYAAVTAIMNNLGKPYWEHEDSMWDTVNNVGLRNHYLCTVYASRMMVPRRQGLIVNISSMGGLRYLFNVPYGIGKAAMDRMAADCSVELKKHNVTMVSLWPGAVKTELIMGGDALQGEYYQPGVGKINSEKMKATFAKGESTEYAGVCIVHLAKDADVMKKTGRVLLSGELGMEYGFVDVDGKSIPSPRSTKYILQNTGWTKLAWLVPGAIKLPYWALALAGNKF